MSHEDKKISRIQPKKFIITEKFFEFEKKDLLTEMIDRVENGYNSNFYWNRISSPNQAHFSELCAIIEERFERKEKE